MLKPRMVRDLAQKLGKKARVIVEGEDVLMDKPQAHHHTFEEVVTIRGEEYIVLRIADIFRIPGDETELDKGIHIRVECGGTKATLFVDDIVGRQQVVLRKLANVNPDAPYFLGVTIHGSGELGLVLNVPGIFSHRKQSPEHGERKPVAGGVVPS